MAAFRGGARWLILPALLMAIPAGVVSAAEVDLDGGVGEKEYRPTSTADLRDRYQLGMGRLEVDLRDVRLPGGDRPLKVDLGVGQAVVIVPEDVCVALDSRVGAGYARLFDRDSGGLDLDWDSTPTAHPAVPRLVLDADVGMGALEVVHDPSDAAANGTASGGRARVSKTQSATWAASGVRRDRKGSAVARREVDVTSLVAGLAIAGFGLLLLLDRVDALDLRFGYLWPAVTATIGVILLASGLTRDRS